MKDKYLMLSKVLVSVMFYLGIPTTIAVPFVLKWYGENMNPYYSNGYYIPQTAIFIVSGIFACLIVYELKNMLKTVEEENCFVKSNVISLDRMGWYSFIIAVVTFIRMSIYFTPGCFAVVIVFVVAGLFAKVLGKVFEQAITYKEDNDLTI